MTKLEQALAEQGGLVAAVASEMIGVIESYDEMPEEYSAMEHMDVAAEGKREEPLEMGERLKIAHIVTCYAQKFSADFASIWAKEQGEAIKNGTASEG